MKKTIIILMIFSVLLSSMVFSENISSRGTNDNKYILADSGVFNQALGSVNTFIKTLSNNNLRQNPLFYDYDNDGTTEIIVSDGADIKIYNKSETSVDLETGFSSNHIIGDYSLYNFDSDLYLVLTAIDSGEYVGVDVWLYNDSLNNFQFVANHTPQIPVKNQVNDRGGYILSFQCDETTGKCLSIFTNTHDIGGSTFRQFLYAYSFELNGTALQLGNFSYTVGTGATDICLPKLSDITLNSGQYWISTYGDSTGDDVNIFALSLNSSFGVNLDTTFGVSSISVGAGIGCASANPNGKVTAPLIADINGYLPEEVVIGVNNDLDEFKMYSFTKSGVTIDDYPEVFLADGVLLSNPFIATAISEHGEDNSDFCVLGYTEDRKLDLLCASEFMTEFFGTGNSKEYITDNNNSFAIQNTNQTLIYGTQMYNGLTNGKNLIEIITPYGVYVIDESNEKLIPIYGIDYNVGTLISNDVENVGFADLIYLTKNALIYIDDKFVNTNAQIDGYSINPCTEQIWKVNTTASISITSIDDEGDNIQTRAILYYGDVNENITQDSGWSTAVASGSTTQFSFTAESLRSNSVIRLMTRDIRVEHQNTSNYIDLVFSVATDGVSYGDCVTTKTDLIEEEIIAGLTDGDIGTYCESSSDCDSGLCVSNFCVLKGALRDCDSNSQCVSGQCVSGKCTKPSISDSLDNAKDELFGADSSTANLISAFFIIGIPIGMVIIAGGSILVSVLAIGIFIVLGFVFTAIEWLSPFILIGIVVFMLIGVVVLLILKGGNQ